MCGARILVVYCRLIGSLRRTFLIALYPLDLPPNGFQFFGPIRSQPPCMSDSCLFYASLGRSFLPFLSSSEHQTHPLVPQESTKGGTVAPYLIWSWVPLSSPAYPFLFTGFPVATSDPPFGGLMSSTLLSCFLRSRPHSVLHVSILSLLGIQFSAHCFCELLHRHHC